MKYYIAIQAALLIAKLTGLAGISWLTALAPTWLPLMAAATLSALAIITIALGIIYEIINFLIQ